MRFQARRFATTPGDLQQASDQLRQQAGRFLEEFDLKGQYNLAASEVTAAEAELSAARWGLDAAEKGEQIADVYKKIGDLQVEIAKLNKEASQLVLNATRAEQQSPEKALVLATRARDLAAARLKALNEALVSSKQMIQQATSEMEAMQPRLREMAKKIRDSKNSFFKILKSIISVVGAAWGRSPAGLPRLRPRL